MSLYILKRELFLFFIIGGLYAKGGCSFFVNDIFVFMLFTHDFLSSLLSHVFF